MAATEFARSYWGLRIATAAAFAIDAYVHADRAAEYDLNRSAPISQGDLFRVEAGVSALLAVLLLVLARRFVWALAVLVAATAFGAVILYTSIDVGRIGPLPDMYEPLWYPKKTLAAIAVAIATATALAGLAMSVRRRVLEHPRGSARAGSPPRPDRTAPSRPDRTAPSRPEAPES